MRVFRRRRCCCSLPINTTFRICLLWNRINKIRMQFLYYITRRENLIESRTRYISGLLSKSHAKKIVKSVGNLYFYFFPHTRIYTRRQYYLSRNGFFFISNNLNLTIYSTR